MPCAAACSGPQSALATAGRDAERIASLFGWMALGAAVIWLGVIALAIYAARVDAETHPRRTATALIIGGGVVLPVAVLTGVLVYGLALLPDVLALPAEGRPAIRVSGEQWWWRVEYALPDGGSVAVANEIRLPVGERTLVELVSPDVIHAFWVPALAGKVDMIPGRVNRIALEPTRTGVFRGACAEYCGTAHALMNFEVVVTGAAEFEAWLRHQREPARETLPEGRRAFLANGCGACHTVRGTPADGVVGPDLTHVGSRLRLGAGILPNEPEAFLRWLNCTDAVKPGVHMPSFGMLPRAQLATLAAYLEALE